jgi:transposase-like protein
MRYNIGHQTRERILDLAPTGRHKDKWEIRRIEEKNSGYPKEFKAEAVALAEKYEKPVRQVQSRYHSILAHETKAY